MFFIAHPYYAEVMVMDSDGDAYIVSTLDLILYLAHQGAKVK